MAAGHYVAERTLSIRLTAMPELASRESDRASMDRGSAVADYYVRKIYDRLRETYRDYCLCSSLRSRVPAITHRLKGDPV